EMMLDQGAKSVRAVCTHAVLSGEAYNRIQNSRLQELIVTNTLELDPKANKEKITQLSIAPIFADVIGNVFGQKSISSFFIN
ncbi:MAG: ribose-phosphate pyrophosphokinase, partial [Flavobacteriales bacterium]